MILSLHLVLWLIALVLFVLGTLGWPATKYSTIAAGLAFFVAGFIFA